MLNGSCVPSQKKGKGVVCQGWLVIGGDFFPPLLSAQYTDGCSCYMPLIWFLLITTKIGWLTGICVKSEHSSSIKALHLFLHPGY